MQNSRSYLQLKALLPLEWGWIAEDELQPVKTADPVAPPGLLNLISCKCQSGCNSKLCSCRKNGLVCVPAARTVEETLWRGH